MKAIIWTKYGPPEVLQLAEIEKPTPEDNQVVIKVHATTVTAGDCEMRSLKFPPYLSLPMRLYAGPLKPSRIQIIGQELSGEVEAVGKDVTRFKVGDQVFASTGFGAGTYAEYVCLPEEPGEMDGVLALKPANLSYQEAAAVPIGGMEALHFLRQAKIERGEKVLVNGAGGSIGTFGLQLARTYGAEVTAVDRGDKLDMLRAIGAEHVIDYTREDFTQSGQTYDVIFDVVGKSPFSGSLKSLNENGRYLIANPTLTKMMRGAWASRGGSKKVIIGAASYKTDDLIQLKELIEAGALKVIIDRSYPLEQIVEAHRYVESGAKKGGLVITVTGSQTGGSFLEQQGAGV
jgi:NADPH:quinone reductase-like Zn-dependent oxidoreductase